MMKKRISKTSQMIDDLLASLSAKNTAKKMLGGGYKKINEPFVTASEILGRRFCINPGPIRKWYKEKYL